MDNVRDGLRNGKATSGVPEIDRLVGGVLPGDNIVWEVDSGAPVHTFVSSFISACEDGRSPVVYVSFNRSPQTVAGEYLSLMSEGLFTLVDCFSSGKGNGDTMFLEFLERPGEKAARGMVHLEDPGDPSKLQEALTQLGSKGPKTARYIFDSLTGMLDLWGDEDRVIRFFGHFCPRLYDLSTIAYWLLEKEAHSDQFVAKVRHVTQVVLEVALSQGVFALTVRKAANRRCVDLGVPQRFNVDNGTLTIVAESREGRELGLLTRMGEALGSALDPNAFFQRTIGALADELGMTRGTLVLLDRTSNKLKIAAAHGLSRPERARGEYAVGEGVTGHVVQTGQAEVIPDISKDSRFLDRTATRRSDLARPIAFICVPLKVDDEVVGALSVDRPFAAEVVLEKDLRLLSIVASIVSQVLKINQLIQVEKEDILASDRTRLSELRSRYRLDNVVGESEGIRRVLGTAATAAKSRASILTTGETGTGKELIANVVHYNSDRAAGPLVKVNCGALPESLLESELFGHVKGAFTGALRDRKGRFELADGGTLFLDEIGEMSARLQVKLLRVLQEGEFEPVGSPRTLSVDVRVVAASSKDLKDEMRHNRFREDLYYRLNVIPIHLPPLRERREDISLLVDHFLEKYNRENHKSITKISRQVLDLLLEYPWPGNIRELENCIERAVVMSPGDALLPCLLPAEVLEHRREAVLREARPSSRVAEICRLTEDLCEGAEDLAEAREKLIRAVDRAVIGKALESGLSQRKLAQELGVSRVTLRKKMEEYGLK